MTSPAAAPRHGFSLGRLARRGETTDPLGHGTRQARTPNPYGCTGDEYALVRPDYPAPVVRAIVRAAGRGGRVLDVGCGTGIMTRQLRGEGAVAVGVDPSAAMRRAFALALPEVECLQGTAEDLPVAAASQDAVVFAQSWHWAQPAAAAREAARVLRPGASLFVVFNQLDVRVAWVQRLTRIMRSGDVHRPDRPPRLGEPFTRPELTLTPWVQHLDVEGVMALGRTRSSYLRATAAGRAHLQRNLDWYLSEHLGLAPAAPIRLPYLTLTWRARLGA